MRNELVYFLVRLVPGHMMAAVASSILAGVSTVALFACIFSLARGSNSGEISHVLIFAALALLFVAARYLSALAMSRVARAAISELRQSLIAGILRTPYRNLEAVGNVRLLTALAGEIQVIAAAASTLVGAVTNFAVVASLLVYIAWLSPVGAAVVVAAACFGIPIYWRVIGGATKLAHEATRTNERLNIYLDGLVSGIKQLRLNPARASDYVADDILGTQDRLLSLRQRAALATAAATNVAQMIFLTVLGGLLFTHLPSHTAGAGVEFYFAVIYLMGPLDGGISAIASLVQINVVFRRNQELGLLLSSAPRPADPGPAVEPNPPTWECIRFDGVTYSYDDSSGFSFGPLTLLLKRGEIVFVKGGNGSGKSTFAKILSGLYDPATGSMFLDRDRIDDISRQPYRERFCCIFDDSYVFEKLCSDGPVEESARDLIREWSLEGRVDVQGSRFTNTRALSRGQKKKLLLIAATIEDREICVFDEWAADQDAQSRRQFYLEYLPRLKRRGKLVVVLTHDEGFDEVADRIIKFHDGMLVAASDEVINARGNSLATSI